jgi:hypothetical protein
MEVLNTYSQTNACFGILALYSICGVGALVLITIFNLIFVTWKNALKCFVFAVILAGIAYGFILSNNITETQYQEVLISDYNKIDFTKWEIAETKGKITVLKEIK